MRPADLEVKHSYAHVNGMKYHYVERGAGPLVVLLHGFPETWWGWRYQIEPLAKAGFRVVALDLRGYGASDRAGPYDMETLAGDIRGLLAWIGADSADFIGHGMGGALAWHMAAHYPRSVDRLALLNCPHPGRVVEALRVRPARLIKCWNLLFFQVPVLPEWLLEGDRWSILERMYQSRALDLSHFSREELQPIFEAAQEEGAAEAMLGWYRAVFQTVLSHRLWMPRYPIIQASTLLIWGKNDFGLGYDDFVPGMEKYAPYLHVSTIERCGHFMQAEQPERVNEALIAFLKAPAKAVRQTSMPGTAPMGRLLDVVLVSAGENKISVIKELRDLTGMELRQAKDLVESAPGIIKSGVSESEADRIKGHLGAVGAIVEIGGRADGSTAGVLA